MGKTTRIQTLNNGKGYIRKRNEMAVLRYYLSYENDEDLARGLCILFLPYRDEMAEIHRHDVKQLLSKHNILIQDKKSNLRNIN